MPTSLQGAEEAIKKHEDFLTTTEASDEKITGVVEAGRRLINDSNANSDKIQEKVDSIQERLEQKCKAEEKKTIANDLVFAKLSATFCFFFFRHLKNKQGANELLTKLKDNRELQHFLQDGQEVKICLKNQEMDIIMNTLQLLL